MKYPRVQIIIDHLKSIDNSDNSLLGFDMNSTYVHRAYTGHKCGSACCIGGHASYLRFMDGYNTSDIDEDLARLCDIPLEDATKICWPGSHGWWGVDYEKTTLEQVISVLENYRDTGTIDWGPVVAQHQEEDEDV